MARPPLAAGPAVQLAPSDYLGAVLPALLAKGRAAPPKASLVVQVLVADLEGCEWFYSVEGDRVEARQGLSDRVDLTLSFLAADVSALSAGELDVARAVRTGRLRVMGDEGVLGWLSKRLAV